MIASFKSRETELIFQGRVSLKYPRSIQVDALSIAENYRCRNIDGRSTNHWLPRSAFIQLGKIQSSHQRSMANPIYLDVKDIWIILGLFFTFDLKKSVPIP